MKTIGQLGERKLLQQVRKWLGPAPEGIALGVGDDCALLRTPGDQLAVTTDALIEGVHFTWDWTRPRELGLKAMAVNLSDLAAMGAHPRAAFLSLSLPGETPLSRVRSFYAGMRAAAAAAGCPLAGGDLTAAPQWAISLTLMGEAIARDADGGEIFLRRSSARPGDIVYVTGQPGESGAGLYALQQGMRAPGVVRRHVRATARLDEGAQLAQLAAAGERIAALDVSDGVYDDGDKLAEASGVGLELDLEALPVSSRLRRLGREASLDPRQWVLYGGEDYELLFTCGRRLEERRDWNERLAPLHAIGRVVKGKGVRLLDGAGKRVEFEDRTFSHF